jgi:hypothetical protein
MPSEMISSTLTSSFNVKFWRVLAIPPLKMFHGMRFCVLLSLWAFLTLAGSSAAYADWWLLIVDNDHYHRPPMPMTVFAVERFSTEGQCRAQAHVAALFAARGCTAGQNNCPKFAFCVDLKAALADSQPQGMK